MKKLIDSPPSGLRRRRNPSSPSTPAVAPLSPETPSYDDPFSPTLDYTDTTLHGNYSNNANGDTNSLSRPTTAPATVIDQALTLLHLLPSTPIPLPSIFLAFFGYLFYSLIPLHLFITTNLLGLVIIKQIFEELVRFEQSRDRLASDAPANASDTSTHLSHPYTSALSPELLRAYATSVINQHLAPLVAQYTPTLQSTITTIAPYIPPIYTSNLHTFMTSGTFIDRISPLFLYTMGFQPEELRDIIAGLPQDRREFLLNSGGLLRLMGAPEGVLMAVLNPLDSNGTGEGTGTLASVVARDLVLADEEEEEEDGTEVVALLAPPPPPPPAPDFIGTTLLPIAIQQATAIATNVTNTATASVLAIATTTLHSVFEMMQTSVNMFSLSMVGLSGVSLLPAILPVARYPQLMGLAAGLNRNVARRVNPLVVFGMGASAYAAFWAGERWAKEQRRRYGGEADDKKDKGSGS